MDDQCEMSIEEKAERYDKIAEILWANIREGNLMQSTMCAHMVRQLDIPSPDGVDSSEA